MSEKIGKIEEVVKGVEWEIGDFHSLEGWYESPQFSFATASWVLEIRVFRTRDENGRVIHLFLVRTSLGPPPVHLEYSVSVKTPDGRTHEEEKHTYVFDTRGSRFRSGCILLYSHRMSQLVPDGFLTVLCALRNMQENEDAGEDCTCKSSRHLHKTKVMRDFQELFQKKEDCDVVIKVKGREFPAHRNILKSRSPVFASTFRCDMKEKATIIVDVEDCDPNSFSDFLCYLYCGAVENLSEQNVFSLFAAADKYEVQDLRAECLQFMKVNLSVDTFCETLTLALRHSESELIQLTTDFFTKNRTIIYTKEWKDFAAENPRESEELLIKRRVPNKN